jgi:hypothetical protein
MDKDNFIKASLAIFVLLAIIISLFPPFEFGDEKLRTLEERNLYYSIADKLPIKEYSFIFSDNKKKFDLGWVWDDYRKDAYQEICTLHRTIIFSELLVEYILAFFVSIIAGYFLHRFVFKKIVD